MNEPRYSGLNLHQNATQKGQANLTIQTWGRVGSTSEFSVNFNP